MLRGDDVLVLHYVRPAAVHHLEVAAVHEVVNVQLLTFRLFPLAFAFGTKPAVISFPSQQTNKQTKRNNNSRLPPNSLNLGGGISPFQTEQQQKE